MTQVFISPHPFSTNGAAVERFRHANIAFSCNALGRKITESELADAVGDAEVLIAGTEPLTDAVFRKAPRLRLIVRVGIGLDNVDFEAAARRDIRVSYTPDAPSKAVAELTIGLMLSLARGIHVANGEIHRGVWNRHLGRRLEEMTIGIVGVGRIGTGVLARLQAFGCRRVLAHDIRPNRALDTAFRFDWVDKATLLRESDIVTLHVPLTSRTRNFIGQSELLAMKRDAFLINTARGAIIDEAALVRALDEKRVAGAALDVFAEEPYSGPFARFEQCLMTAHMGSMSVDSRARMENEAVDEALRFLRGEPMLNEVVEDPPLRLH